MRYRPLADWLRTLSDDEADLTLDRIEAILGVPLPDSARKHVAYWYGGNPIGREIAAVGWRARPRLRDSSVRFTRVTQATELQPEVPPQTSRDSSADVILLGCVKTKHPGRHPARELYTSTLFLGRRRYAEQTGTPWYVLSARYGLIAPDEVIDTYDVALAKLSAPERRAWGQRVLTQVDDLLGNIEGKTIEIHAGAEYRESGVVRGLRERGATVIVPLEGMRFGEQLRWYPGEAPAPVPQPSKPPPPATPRESAPPRTLDELKAMTARLTEDFVEGRLDLSSRKDAPTPSWDAMPEFRTARVLKARGFSDRKLRLAVTFIGAMDRARDADTLWDNAAVLHSTAGWAFDPAAVATRSRTELAEALKTSGVSQRHDPDSTAWWRIAEALQDPSSPPAVRRAIFDGTGDAEELLEVVRKRDSSGSPWFPLLQGPKISVLWVRMLAAPGGASITNLDRLPVAVDTQIRKVSEYLGVTDTVGLRTDEARPIIQEAWHRLSPSATGPEPFAGTGAALDPALWFFGKWGCTICKRAGKRMPISDVCSACRFTPLQRQGAGATPP